MEVAKFLKEEKKRSKEVKKKILKEAPHAIPQGKKYRVEIEDIKAPGTDPTISAKVLWLEKRSGVELTGQVSGVATHSVRGALLNLKDKVDDMVKAQK